jgi:hypothetical protein
MLIKIIKNEDKANDLKLSFFTAVHISIRSIDHLSELLKKTSETLKNLKLHRTKCSATIRKINRTLHAFRRFKQKRLLTHCG